MIQARHADASERFVSLDDVYYYGGGIGVNQVAVEDHEPRNNNEIELKTGDLIGLAGNHWNGMSKGTNRRTNRVSKLLSISTFQLLHKILHGMVFFCRWDCFLPSRHVTCSTK